MILRLLAVLTFMLLGQYVSAQSNVRQLRGVVIDSVERMPLVGASVIVTSARDTVAAITNTKGEFRVDRLRDSVVQAQISYLGHQKFMLRINLKESMNRLDTIILAPEAFALTEVVVQGERPLMGQRGDTIVFHAEAIKVLPGDESMQLVKRLPGVELVDGKITIMGKVVERTYVDKKPLFGENAQSALEYLEARDVIDIEVYDELIEEEQIKGHVNGKKRTVMNLVTRSKPEKSINISGQAGYGADMDPAADGRHGQRYNTSAEYNYFSEKKSLNLNGGTNNSNQGSGYHKNTRAGISLSRRWSESLFLEGHYNYNNNYDRSQSVSRQVYFPTAEYESRSYDDTSRTTNLSHDHSANLNLRYNTKQDFLYFTPQIRFSQGNSGSYRGALNLLNGEVLNRVASTNQNDTRSYNISENLNWSHSFKESKHGITTFLNGSMSRNNDTGWQVDSLASDSTRTYLENQAQGWSNTVEGGLGYFVRFKEKNSFGVNYNISYENSRSQRVAVDRFTGLIDTALTYDYTRNYTTQNYSFNFNRYTEKLHLSVSAGYQSARLNKDEAFPKQQQDQVTFRSLRPAFSLNYTLAPTRRIYFNYATYTRQPSVEQLRNELKYENPLNLSGGNPSLSQSYSHSIYLGYNSNLPKRSRTFNVNLSAELDRQEIATKQIFFTQDTPLPQYNGYVALKGSTLTTPVNVNGAGSVRGGMSFSQLIKPLQGTFSVNTGCSYNRRPSYIGAQLNYTNTLSPQVGLSFSSTESTVYQFSLYTNVSYNRSANSQKSDNNTLSQQLGTNLTVNFLKKLYCTTQYNYSLYHNFSYADGDVNTHILNLTLGCKFFEKRQLDVNCTLSDLLNRTDNFSTRMMADYINYTWTQRAGRYFMFNVSYKFNKTGKLKTKD